MLVRCLLAACFLAACGPSIPDTVRPAPTGPGDHQPDPKPGGDPVPVGGGATNGSSFHDDVGQNPLKINMIDVGQGDSILIETPGGKRILIDSGPSSARDSLLGWLDHHGATRLDLVINTHAHADHIANTWRVIETRDIGMVLDSGVPHTTRDYQKMLDAVERKSIPLKIARKGRRIELDSGATLTVLAPEEPLVSGSRSDINANSVVVRLDYGDISALFTGDAESETEQRLLADAANLHATILKVAHHGSRHATGDAFLKAVGPRIALISAAQRNRYSHPAPSTLAHLLQAGVATFETRLHGTITVATDGKGLNITTEKSSAVAMAPEGNVGEAPEEEAVPSAKLDLNTASREALIELPGIGPSTADRILEFRKSHGPFHTVEDLSQVKGIGPKTMEKLRPLVSVVPAGT